MEQKFDGSNKKGLSKKGKRLISLTSLLILVVLLYLPFYKKNQTEAWLQKHGARAYYTRPDWTKKLPGFVSDLFKQVDVLIIADSNIEDFSEVLSFKKLRILNIENSKVKNIDYILRLKNIELIHASGSNMSDELLRKLKEINPNCEVTRRATW